jgi:hypothetical protein
MHHLYPVSRRKALSLELSPVCQDLVRFFGLLRIKPHAPPLVRVPVNSFEFQPCGRNPQAEYLISFVRHRVSPTPSTHRLRRGLPGYLILFAPHAFVPQRQSQTSKPPSPLVFLHISTHSTAPHRILLASSGFKPYSFRAPSTVKPWAFNSDL